MPGTEHGQSSFSIALSGSGERPEDMDLADLVNQSEPLRVHCTSTFRFERRLNEYQSPYDAQQVKYMRKTCAEPVEASSLPDEGAI